MAMGLQAQLRAQREATERWIRQREAQLRESLGDLEARGRRAYGEAIRAGHDVIARTPAELRALGLAAATGRLPQAVGTRVAARIAQPAKPSTAVRTAAVAKPGPRAPTASPSRPTPDARGQLQAGVSGAVDEFSFGLADRALAAAEALREGGLQGFGDRYNSEMAIKAAEDAYDARHYGAARNAGRIAGLGASVAVMGAPAVGRAVVSRLPRGLELLAHIAKAPKLKGVDPRGLPVLAATGGATANLIGQGVTDVISGRVSSPGDYVGAAAGGALGGLATLRQGPVRGGVVGGAATSVSQDKFNGRALSIEDAIEAGHLGGVMGGATGALGTYGSAALPKELKGKVGEALSLGKTLARGERPIKAHRAYKLKGGGHTFTDHQTRSGKIIEAKLGPTADLSRRQQQARRQLGSDYVVDSWQFSDVGKALSAPGAAFGPQFADEERFSWRLR